MGGIVNSAGETLCEDHTAPATRASGPAAHAAEPPRLVIERRPGWRPIDLRELWRFRELLVFLVWRDIKVRYKQTVLGAAWAVLQPFATMVVFSFFFGQVLSRQGGDQVRYPLFVFAGLLPWTFLSNAISNASQSVVGSQNMVTKVYFPRLIIPMGAAGVGLVDFLIGFAMLVLMMAVYGVTPGWSVLLAPLVLVILTGAALGIGLLLAALTVAYRDFRYVIPFSVQLWMFATPGIYMQNEGLFGPRWEDLLPLNPAQGLITAFRQTMLDQPLDLYSLSVSSVVSLVLLVVGAFYFRGVERNFADII